MAGPSFCKLQVMRRRTFEQSAQAGVFWNGTVTSSKEGNIAAETTAVDYTTLLCGETLLLFPRGSKGGSGHGIRGRYPRGHAYGGALLGRGNGPRGRSDRGFSDRFFEWSTRAVGLALRDGVYRFGIRLYDRKENRDSGPGVEERVLIKNTPRSPKDLQFVSYTGTTLSLKWRASLCISNPA